MQKEAKDFLEFCSISAGKNTLNKIEHKINIINGYFKGNLNNLALKDIHGFLAWLNKSRFAKATRNDIIKILKRFLKWKYPDWSKRFNDLKDAKLNPNAQRQLSKEDLLTPEEMNVIIKSVENMKYKTLLLFFQETACRPEEVLKLRWKEIDMNKGEVKLHSNKTDKTRFIPLKNTLDHLRRYKEECFTTTPKAEERVFDLTPQAVQDFLNNLERNLNFSKHLYPYLWRHSILSRMIKTLSPKVYEMYAGHSLETGMGIYAHLDNEDLRNELFEKVYKIEKLTTAEREELKELRKKIMEITQDYGDFLGLIINFMKSKNNEEKDKSLKEMQKYKGKFLIKE